MSSERALHYYGTWYEVNPSPPPWGWWHSGYFNSQAIIVGNVDASARIAFHENPIHDLTSYSMRIKIKIENNDTWYGGEQYQGWLFLYQNSDTEEITMSAGITKWGSSEWLDERVETITWKGLGEQYLLRITSESIVDGNKVTLYVDGVKIIEWNDTDAPIITRDSFVQFAPGVNNYAL